MFNKQNIFEFYFRLNPDNQQIPNRIHITCFANSESVDFITEIALRYSHFNKLFQQNRLYCDLHRLFRKINLQSVLSLYNLRKPQKF